MNPQHLRSIEQLGELSHRRFLGGTLAAAAAAPLVGAATSLAAAEPAVSGRKIKLGLVGCGGRGKWIGHLFQRHGGYQLHAVADYFPHVVDGAGEELGVDKAAASPACRATRR